MNPPTLFDALYAMNKAAVSQRALDAERDGGADQAHHGGRHAAHVHPGARRRWPRRVSPSFRRTARNEGRTKTFGLPEHSVGP